MGEDKEKEMYLNACLEEYKTLREESRQASINMITSLAIGLGVTIFLALSGVNLFVDGFTLTPGEIYYLLCVFCIILPLLLGLIIALWLGELARFKRAGNFICFIEEKISMLLNDFYETRLIILAAQKGNLEILKELIKAGANWDTIDFHTNKTFLDFLDDYDKEEIKKEFQKEYKTYRRKKNRQDYNII